MSRARRLLRLLSAAVAVGALTLAPAQAASAADELGAEWGGDTVNLAWDGSTYTTSTQSFVGVPVAVPGDRAYRRLVVTNDGPTAGILRAWVVDVDLDGPPGAASRFFDDLTVDWKSASATSSASLRSLEGAERTRIARVRLAAGESTEITVGYAFPVTATSGNRQQEGELSASFDVLLRLGGETGGEDGPPSDEEPGEDDQDGKDDTEGDGDGDTEVPDGELPRTGAELGELVALVAGMLGLGVVLILAARRRQRRQG